MTSHDLIIIGAGPGGYTLAAEAARKGSRVALIEADEAGGTCLNRGCIPTKTLCASGSEDWETSQARARSVVDDLRESVISLLRDVELISACAELLPDGSVRAGDRILTAPKTVIATGSAPSRLPVTGKEFAWTSDELLAYEGPLPDSFAVIGGGVIGLEFASILCEKGVNVTVVEFCREILPGADKDMAKRLRLAMQKRGIKFITGAEVTEIKENGTVIFKDKKGVDEVNARAVLMAVGRKAVLPPGYQEVGIELTPKGFIKVVPTTLETNIKGIYAIGDCNGLCMLAHAAEAQGRRFMGVDTIDNVMPSVVFTQPELAWAGLTEDKLKEAGIEFKTGRASYSANGKALAESHTDGLVKVFCDAGDGRLLGASILGHDASSLIGEASMAVAAGLTAGFVAGRMIHPHPTLTEIFASACANCL